MNNDDKIRFATAFGKAAINYSKELTKDHLQILWDDLEEFDINGVEEAIKLHMRRCKYFPVIADIIELIPEKSAKTWKKGDMVSIGGKMRKVLN